jgi:hypothetical protein
MQTINIWFEAKIQYDKIGTEDGKQKKVTDTYLVDAMSFTEAEARVIEVVRPYMTGDFTVAALKRAKVHEIFENATGDKWYRAKVVFIVLDAEKGKEKKIGSIMLVQADDIEQARTRLEEAMKGTMSDYEVVKIEETPILDVVKYEEKVDPEDTYERVSD